MTLLVTGGAGFIGSHLVERLLDNGEAVVCLDSFDDFYAPELKSLNLSRARRLPGFTEVRGDIRNRSLLDSLPRDIDTVIHLAARAGVRPSISDPGLYTSVNVDGTVTMLEWARDRGIRKFVFGSSSSVYGDSARVPFAEDDPVDRPISPYAATKRAGELLCHTFHHLHGMGVVALRFFTVYGPRQRPDLAIHKFARLLLDRRPLPVYGDGTTARDYTYIDDIVDGVISAIELLRRDAETFEVINLGESRTISLSEMIDVLARGVERVPVIHRLPAQPGDVMRTWADIRKAGRLLGYQPKTTFADGIGRFLVWLASIDKEEVGASNRLGSGRGERTSSVRTRAT